MEIVKGSINGSPSVSFQNDPICYFDIAIAKEGLRFLIYTGIASFSQEDIQALLPYLQSFAETGQLEPQQSTLQGGMISVDFVKSVIERYMNDHDAFDACEAILQDLALPETKHAQSPTLQGGDERVEAIANASAKCVLDILEAQNNGLATMQEAGVAMAQNIVEQGKRIQALEDLVREWKKFGQGSWQSKHPCALMKETDQLLGE